MDNKLNLNREHINMCNKFASEIVENLTNELNTRSTVSIERTIARLHRVDGVNEFDIPYPNILIDHLKDKNVLDKGISYWLGNAIIQTGLTPQEIAERVNAEELDITSLEVAEYDQICETIFDESKNILAKLDNIKSHREKLKNQYGENPSPHTYVLTATGNVYEDVTHAIANANYGGDIIAVIRSTAQSLLDYVPYGATTEGYGGTYATQENFKIMREALDKWMVENGRYLRLSSFCSGLCMPEIAAIGALEGLDNMANDALYGILYRDINMIRTLIDQKMSRMINGYSGIVINTGEDNYLRTANAVKAAPSVVASQMINYYFAKNAGLEDDQIGIGNSYEIDPDVENGFLYEFAQAQLTRELFPKCQIKYMPPTKHMNGNIFRTHAIDTLFNLITIATDQKIQTIGVPTEGFYTPIIQDRTLSLENVKFVFKNAKNFGDEIEFKKDGIIQKRAQDVLKEAMHILEKVNEIGLFNAIQEGIFGDIKRGVNEGKGLDGVFLKENKYINPFYKLILGE